MKNRAKYLLPLIAVMATLPAQAQWYNDGASTNAGSLISDWTSQGWNTATASYTTAGSTGAPNNYGVFEHYGQSGTGNNSALRNDGSYDASLNGRDYFMGPGGAAGQQGIGGTTAPVFGELFLQNGTGQLFDITNSNGARVATSASFSNGITTTVRSANSTGSLRFLDNATYTNTALGDAQYVNGYVTKVGNDAFTFPVGSQAGNDLRTLQINAPASVTDQLSVAYWTGDAAAIDPTPSGTQSRASLNPSGTIGVDQLSSVSPLCFWDWIPVSGTSAITITVSLPNFAVPGGYANPATMRLVGWNTATQQWDNLSGSTGATGVAEGSTLAGTVSNMSQYSAIGVGDVFSAPLPVTITAFNGYMDNQCTAHLEWTTVNESSLAKFVIQYSTDGREYITAGEVAAGNTTGNTYHFEQADIARGNVLFRLMIMDKRGSSTYYNKTLSLHSDCGKKEGGITVAPNPARDDVYINGLQGSNALQLFDATGRNIGTIATDKASAQLSLKAYAPGTYLLRVMTNGREAMSTRIVKQ